MDVDATTVGFDLQTNLIVVGVEINGHAAPFLLDTGASVTVLSERFAQEIGIPKARSQSGAGAGGGVETWMADVASIGVGDLRTGRSTCAIMRFDSLEQRIGSNIRGILGFDFLGRGVLTIDYPRKEITLRWARTVEPESIVLLDGQLSLPLEQVAWTLPDAPWTASRETSLASILAELRHPDGASIEIQLVQARGIGLEQAILSVRPSLEMQIEGYEAGGSGEVQRAGRNALRLNFTGRREGTSQRYVSELILTPSGLILVTASAPEGAPAEILGSIERFLASAVSPG